ncbi:hypothetical protein P691DRAFT_528411 [Macrolepiota fuliginosa MF-IS2]|uniref:Uncharacterized protein n=1 Tax=Macrolepiota fuliginosa MF-IS2 TaxID=1400762 RepID=A0A9P5XND6_9AGAR|nr:hypothetical protein P691DRAFT_528411 [Macrolepiota fuliginosa MF-IS2]
MRNLTMSLCNFSQYGLASCRNTLDWSMARNVRGFCGSSTRGRFLINDSIMSTQHARKEFSVFTTTIQDRKALAVWTG